MVSLRTHPIYSIRHKMMFGSVSKHFANLRREKRCKTCVSRMNALIRGYLTSEMVSVRTPPIYSIRLKMMFGSVSKHFANFRHKKWCETCVSSLNALFRGTELSKMVSLRKHPIHSIRPKVMFGIVLDHFANLRHEKWCKTCVSGLSALIRGYRTSKNGFATNASNLLY